jgi:NAD(P)-dependent dehydrogenase (short-subunit alcohol dehydrogenase family)
MLADLSSQASIRQMVSDVKDRYRQLQVLVNNAGVFLSKRSMSEDESVAEFGIGDRVGHFRGRFQGS